jgi:hypothetical protein
VGPGDWTSLAGEIETPFPHLPIADLDRDRISEIMAGCGIGEFKCRSRQSHTLVTVHVANGDGWSGRTNSNKVLRRSNVIKTTTPAMMGFVLISERDTPRLENINH